MFFQILTLLVLALVLLLKYFASVQTGNPKQRQIEIQNECNRGEHRHRMLCEERQSLEEQQRGLLVSRMETEDQLGVTKHNLSEQEEKIQEMEDRIDSTL
jgi:septal ring factor EnvC (AmiA/AmiB activator)